MKNWIQSHIQNTDTNTCDNFMTFIKSEYADYIKQAAEITGFNVYIGRRTRHSGYVEVRTKDALDHTPFWNKFAELRDEEDVSI